MKRVALIDIGELGWSLYLVAHARWLKEQGNKVLVMTSKDRRCLYEGVADTIMPTPQKFYEIWGEMPQHCLGRYGANESELVEYFERNIPKSYVLADKFRFNCVWFFEDKMIHAPFKMRQDLNGKGILIFPRWRPEPQYATRNLPKDWWIGLVNTLCMVYSDFRIIALGTKNGAYDLEEVKSSSFENLVGKTESVQDVIDLCSIAITAIGSASSLPKISLLQGVPTFVIGHEKERVIKTDNWLNTEVGFREIGIDDYNSFDDKTCDTEIMNFINRFL
jgi:hypothetical protein